MDDGSWLILGLLAVAAVLLGPIGFFLALGARRRLTAAERGIFELQKLLRAQAAPAPAPATLRPEAPQSAAIVPPQRDPPADVDPVEAPGEKPEPLAPVTSPTPQPAMPPPSTTPGGRTGSLEETLGTRWAVWVGGLALALGALLLVRYSIEQGWFNPAARILLGLALAAALIVAGEYLRRREAAPGDRDPAASAQPPVSAMLTAAGTVAAFAAIYAAHALYGFIGPGFAFLALGATGLACMLAAALHGPALAGIGLAGALAVPLLVSSGEPNPWAVVIYVAVVTASAYGLARLRLWLWLALAAAAGGLAWGGLLILGSPGGLLASLLHVLMQTALACFVFALDRPAATPDDEARIDPLATLVPAAFGLLAMATLAAGSAPASFDLAWQIGGGAVIAILAATGVIAAPAALVMSAATIVLLGALWLWPADPAVSTPALLADALRAGLPWAPATPLDPGSFTVFALILTLAIAGLALRRLLRGEALPPRIAALYAGCAALTPLAALVLAYVRLAHSAASLPFAGIAGGLALAYLFVGNMFRNRMGAAPSEVLRLGLGAAAAAALAAVALGLVFVLDRGMLTVALALAALGAAYVERQLDIPALRWCVLGLGLVTAGRLAWDPRIVGADLGTTPVFNWLLWGYGVPAAAFGLAARLFHRGLEDTPVRVAEALSILFAAFLVFFEIRHAIHGGNPYAGTSGLVEQGLFATAGFGFSIVSTRLDGRRSNPVFRFASLGFGLMSFALTLGGLLIAENPLFTDKPIEGGVVLNAILLAYGLPALLALVLGVVARGVRPNWYRNGARLAALLLVFALVSLEVRRLFHGPRIGLGGYPGLRTSDREWYSYSAVWLVLGILLLAYGIWRGLAEARLASAVFVVATVLKVFLFDLSGLEGMLRALSFIGLGLVLIGIGLVYQKLVFAPRPAPS